MDTARGTAMNGSSSRLSGVVRWVNRALTKLGTPGRLVAVGDDWYNEDGLVCAHNWSFVHLDEFTEAYQYAAQRSGLGSGPKWRTHVALWAARNCVGVPGDFIELGVGRGWMASAIIRSLPWKDIAKDFWLFDRFEDRDADPISGEQLSSRNSKGTYSASLNESRQAFEGVPNIRFVAGSLPDSLRQRPQLPVAFIHADLNAAVPESRSVEILWANLSSGGMVLFDDFAYRGYSPQYTATLKLAERLGVPVLALPTGQGLIVKPS